MLVRRTQPVLPTVRWFALLHVFGLAFILFIFLFRLETYPAPWFDEGAYVNVAQTFARDGVYAETSSEGYRYTGPVVSTGPTVILPVALVYALNADAHLATARVVIILYGLLLLAAMYVLSRHLAPQNTWFPPLVIALVMLGWGNNMPFMVRNVMGEAPGLALMFTGIALWFGRESLLRLVIVGVLFGLAAITKNQITLFLLPGLFLAWLLDLFYYRQHHWRYFVIPGIIAGVIFFGWTYYAFYLLGASGRDVSADLAALQEAGGNGYFVLDISNKVQNFFGLTNGLTYGGLFIPAALFGGLLAFRRDDMAARWGILWVLLVMASAVYVLSIGWERIAIMPKVIAALFVARMVISVRPDFRQVRSGSPAALWGLLLVGLAVIVLILPLFRTMFYVVRGGDRAPYMVADYLNQTVEHDVLIETWEKELSALTNHTYHFPPQVVEAYVNADLQGMGEPANERYDFRDYGDPAVIVVGPLGERGELYPEERLDAYVLAETFGLYTIYRKDD